MNADVAKELSTDTMSSQLTALVPIFDSQNFNQWSRSMKAFLMAQSLWAYVNGDVLAPDMPIKVKDDASDDAKKAYKETMDAWEVEGRAWSKVDDVAMGNIILCLSPSLQQNLSDCKTSNSLWEMLKAVYQVATAPTIYADFKEVISFRFDASKAPAPQFDKLRTAFSRLTNTMFGPSYNQQSLHLQQPLQAMIALATLPQKWEHLIPIIINNSSLEDLNIGDVHQTVVTQWETEMNCGQHRGAHNAQKLSAVKHK
jgi:hypothetical protein